MKVIHIFNELKFSGAEIMYVDAAPIFHQLGCELSVVNTTQHLGEYAQYFENSGYQVFFRPFPSPKRLIKRIRYCFDFIKFLKRESYDVVHIHSQRMMWIMAFCAYRAHIRSIYTCHSVFKIKHIYTYVYRYLSRWSAKYIFRCKFHTISDSVYNNEKKYFYNESVKINNWYGSSRFYPAGNSEKEVIRKNLGIPSNSLVLITIGGCSPVKRHTDMIKSLAAIIKQYPNTIYFHLGEGICLQEEQILAENLHLTDHIVFSGNQKDVRKYLIASDIYVMTSKHEGSPLTTIEAMACGIPAVLYDVPGLKDFNHEEECALLVREDPSELAESIVFLYENQEKQQELVAHALHFVNTQFDMKTNVAKIFELYQP